MRAVSLPAAPLPHRAVTTVWVVVNLVNILQAAGFATRAVDPHINRILGIGILALAVPAGLALMSFVKAGSPPRLSAGPLSFLAFCAVSLLVDYVVDVEFRAPRRPEILIPYLMLFFGSIVLMGAPMLRIDRRRWFVTLVTTLFLVGGMGWAMSRGLA
jgi:hypothetical protein